MIEDSGFVDVRIGPPVDTFGGAKGEPNARKFEVFGYAFIAASPSDDAVDMPRGASLVDTTVTASYR
jgi:hypothetical protein